MSIKFDALSNNFRAFPGAVDGASEFRAGRQRAARPGLMAQRTNDLPARDFRPYCAAAPGWSHL